MIQNPPPYVCLGLPLHFPYKNGIIVHIQQMILQHPIKNVSYEETMG